MRKGLSPGDSRRAWLYAALIVLLMLLCGALVWFASTRENEEAYLPATSQAVQEAAKGLDSITIDASFDPYSRLLSATQVMTLRNPSGRTLDSVTLRSYSGAYLQEDTSPAASDELFYDCYGTGFSAGGLVLESALVNGKTADFVWEDAAHTVLSLPAQWAAGSKVTVELHYTVSIPQCASRFGEDDGIFSLGNVFPTLALWEDDGWRTEGYCAIGDPFLSACANWTVRLSLPSGYTVAGTGHPQAANLGDGTVYTLQAQAVRDFALVISDQFTTASGMADDVLVTACAKDNSAAQRMVKYARQAIACYEQHYGEYVYPTLTLAEVSFPYGGMEYPRMVMIGDDIIAAGDDSLEIAVAHEVAHQWWYAMVGSDSYTQAWQDESLCEYALLDYVGQVYGAAARENTAFDRIETAMRITVPRGVTPGSPIDYFQDLSEYATVVYRRGAALWLAMENLLGKDALDAALQGYVQQHLFGFATRENLTRVLSTAAGQDVSTLMEDYLDTYIVN